MRTLLEDLLNNRYKSLSLTIGASALVIFLLCAWLVGSHAPALNANDAALRSLVNAHRTNWGTAFFTHLTLTYNSTGTTIIAGFVTLVALLGFSWRAGLQVALTVATGSWLNHYLKSLFQRSRPTNDVLMHYGGWSFPSAHAALSALTMGCLVLLILRTKWPTKYRHPLATLAVVFALLIGFSRLYVGAHFLSDVIGGWALGITVVAFFDALFHRFLPYQVRSIQWAKRRRPRPRVNRPRARRH